MACGFCRRGIEKDYIKEFSKIPCALNSETAPIKQLYKCGACGEYILRIEGWTAMGAHHPTEHRFMGYNLDRIQE